MILAPKWLHQALLALNKFWEEGNGGKIEVSPTQNATNPSVLHRQSVYQTACQSICFRPLNQSVHASVHQSIIPFFLSCLRLCVTLYRKDWPILPVCPSVWQCVLCPSEHLFPDNSLHPSLCNNPSLTLFQGSRHTLTLSDSGNAHVKSNTLCNSVRESHVALHFLEQRCLRERWCTQWVSKYRGSKQVLLVNYVEGFKSIP